MTAQNSYKSGFEQPNARVTSASPPPMSTETEGTSRMESTTQAGSTTTTAEKNRVAGKPDSTTARDRTSDLGGEMAAGLNSLADVLSRLLSSRQTGGNTDLRDLGRWSALIGGGALAIYGLRRSLGSFAIAGLGIGMVYRGLTGRWPLANITSLRSGQVGRGSSMPWRAGAFMAGFTSITQPVTKSIIVKADLERVYNAWADFENFPHFMENIKSVVKTGERTSHWVMEGPFSMHIEWDAETTRLEKNKRIAWNSITGEGRIKTSGQVTFNALPNEEVEVTATLRYVPPAGLAGEIAAELFGDPEGRLVTALRNFKHYIEARDITE
jgi:uncharacterized membrane protein